MHSEVFFFRQSRLGPQFELLALNLELILSLNDLLNDFVSLSPYLRFSSSWLLMGGGNFLMDGTDIFCKIKEKDLTPFIPLYDSRPDLSPT